MSDTCHSPRPADVATTTLTVALAGNPNVGKSSLFNALTGAHQHVGNWPGKTVERLAGTCRLGAAPITVVDLPGTYSLAASSPEEVVAEAALASDEIDAVAVVLDSTNLERTLYLAAQLAELGRPLVLVLNMTDRAQAEGLDVDADRLAAAFGAPVVRTVARTGAGIPELVEAFGAFTPREADRAPGAPTREADRAGTAPAPTSDTADNAAATRPIYDGALAAELETLEEQVAALELATVAAPRWLALQLLDGDAAATAVVGAHPGGAAVVAAATSGTQRVEDSTGLPAALAIADRRYDWVHEVAGAAVTTVAAGRSRTDRIDDVLTSRWAGIPIFLALMWVVFKLVTDVAAPFIDWVDGVVAGPVSALATAALGAVGLGGTWIADVIVDGGIAGVGAVLVFVPVLAVLYLAMGVLEDSGYMARAAFLMDRVMRPIGLSGKSFLPLLLGFGCNVPGVYATRVLDRRRDRVVTSLMMPFVTCAARLPIYVLLAAAFFPGARGTVVFVMYLASIVVVLLVGALLDRIVLRSERRSSFVLELPAYRRPSARLLATYVWQRIRAFVTKAGTVILACAVVVWLLLAIPVTGGGSFNDTAMEDSAFATTAQAGAPMLAPAGLGTWEVTGTLITGLVAKEVVVATLEQVYAPAETTAEEADAGVLAAFADAGTSLVAAVRDAAMAVPGVIGIDVGGGEEEEASFMSPLQQGFDEASGGHGRLAAAAFLAFMLLYVPCMATIGAIRHELGGRWALASVGLNFVLAWSAAVAVFQFGRLLGLG